MKKAPKVRRGFSSGLAAMGAGLVLLVCAVLAPAMGGCKRSATAAEPGGGEASGVIQNGGSDTMLNLAQMWSEEYSKLHPRVKVNVTGGGSGVGIRDLTRGMVTIANASRNMTAMEREQTIKNTGQEPSEFVVAYDAIAIYVHKDNPISEITVDELAGIYGEARTITTWSQLGVQVPRDEIILFGRMNSSGTYDYFRERVLKKKDYRLNIHSMSGSKDVVELIGQTLSAIGYSGMGYKNETVKFVRVATKKGETAWEPTTKTVHDQRYPLARSLNMYTLGRPQAEVKTYIDWLFSPAGQGIVTKAGYIPIAAATR